MQLRRFFALAIYVGSYLPLSLILLVQDIDFAILRHGACPVGAMVLLNCAIPLKNPALSLSALVVCIIGSAAAIFVLRVLPTVKQVTVIESKHVPADLINYVIPYVVSFISLDYGDPPKLLGFAVFLGWIYLITVKSGQILLNPALAVLGWRLFEVKYTYHGSRQIFVGRMLSQPTIEPDSDYHMGVVQDVIVVREAIARETTYGEP
jgi:hypothetical protein